LDYIKPFIWPLMVFWKVFVVKPFEWGKKHWKGLGVALLALGLVALGWFGCKHFNQNVVTKTEVQTVEKEVPVEVPVFVKGDTEIRYVEKETPSDSDIEITSPPPVISVSYNGEKTELDGVKGETQKFDKGKLQVEQKTEATLDVTPVVEREVNSAVESQKLQDDKEKTEAVSEEKHKAHKHGQKTLLGGIGIGILAGLLL